MRKDGLAKYATIAVLALLVAAGSYLRLHGLGRPSLWVDEVNHVLAGRALSQGEEPRFPSGEPNTRALAYSRLVALSLRVFGESEASARLPSAVFGILTIPLVYVLGRSLGTRGVGLLAAFLVTFSHFEIGWSRLCRMYTMFQFFFLLAVWAGLTLLWSLKGLRSPLSRPKIAGLAFLGLLATALAASVHILTAEILAIFYVYLFALVVLEVGAGERAGLRGWDVVVLVAGAVAVIAAFLVPQTRRFLLWVLTYKPGWADWSLATDSHYYFWFLTESKRWPLLAFFVIGTLFTISRDDRRGWFWVIGFLLPVAAQTFLFSYRLKNYIFHVFPLFLIGAAVGFLAVADWLAQEMNRTQLWNRWFGHRTRTLALLFVLAWVPLTVWFRYGVKVSGIGSAGDNGAVNHLDWKGATRFVAEHLGRDDVVISTLPLTVQYYLGRCDYNLNLANARSDLEWSDSSRAGQIDFYSGAQNIPDLSELRRVLRDASGTVWLIADRYRFSKAGYVPPEVADFVRQHFRRAWTSPSGTVDVFAFTGAVGSEAE